MDTAILARVEDFCIREGLLQPGAPLRLAAAVSGGADSMALLLLLRQLQPRFGYTLSACHVNHGLRGQSADRDEAFVRAECARLGVPLRVFHAAELASPPAHAGEDWARRLRYTAFAQLQGQGIDAIATAHTANDQAETLLLRLARGTGLHGAGGIRPRRGCYLRPLLCLSRAETEAVCRAAGQPWVTDETNDTDAYARNRLRHSALPALESTNAAAVQNLARFCEKAARADAYLAAVRSTETWRCMILFTRSGT
jgi:tRNA(Ile)-lysidine synthase